MFTEKVIVEYDAESSSRLKAHIREHGHPGACCKWSGFLWRTLMPNVEAMQVLCKSA